MVDEYGIVYGASGRYHREEVDPLSDEADEGLLIGALATRSSAAIHRACGNASLESGEYRAKTSGFARNTFAFSHTISSYQSKQETV